MAAFAPQRWTRTWRHRAKTFVGARPWLFFPLFRPRPAFDDLLVTRSTDLCIEGFPRSGNSFAVGAVEHAQSTPVRIAHHTHVPANAMRACEWDTPTLVLIRDPCDAAVSHVALAKEVQAVEHNADAPIQLIPFQDQLDAWLTFYRSLEPYRDRMVVAPLRSVANDMGHVIGRINEHFGTDFERFDHTPDAVAKVHSEQGYHAGPSERRAALKEETRADLDERLRTDPSLRETVSDAEALYEGFIGDSAAVTRS
jgi:hypothetical protein